MAELVTIIDTYEKTVRETVIKQLQQQGYLLEEIANRVSSEEGISTYNIDRHTMYWLTDEQIQSKRTPICLVGPEIEQKTDNSRVIKICYGQEASVTFDNGLRKEVFYRTYVPYIIQ